MCPCQKSIFPVEASLLVVGIVTHQAPQEPKSTFRDSPGSTGAQEHPSTFKRTERVKTLHRQSRWRAVFCYKNNSFYTARQATTCKQRLLAKVGGGPIFHESGRVRVPASHPWWFHCSSSAPKRGSSSIRRDPMAREGASAGTWNPTVSD